VIDFKTPSIVHSKLDYCNSLFLNLESPLSKTHACYYKNTQA